MLDFVDDDTLYYAASLSFFTIFSFLPIFALLLVFISSMTFFNDYLALFLEYIFDFINQAHSESIKIYIMNFLENTNHLGDIGIVYLFFVFTMFFKDYEHVVSNIHKRKKMKLVNLVFLYIAFMILLPAFFVLFSYSISLIDQTFVQIILAYLFTWVLFIILFYISNQKIFNFKAVMISSFITITILQVMKNIFTYYVQYNETYTTIYGSFSVLLFFFLWIYISWIIYLYGMKLYYKLSLFFNNRIKS